MTAVCFGEHIVFAVRAYCDIRADKDAVPFMTALLRMDDFKLFF